MEVEEARPVVQRLAAELVELRAAAATATRHAAAVSKIISGYVERFPELGSLVDEAALLHAENKADDDTPKGAEAVRLILQGQPDAWFFVSELVEALRTRGWLPDSDNPANAVRAALERLVNTPDSDVTKGRQGSKVVYSYRPDDAPPARPEAAPGDYDDEEPF